MKCLQEKCRNYITDKSQQYGLNFCRVTVSCLVTDNCPIENIIQHYNERLTDLNTELAYIQSITE